MPSTSTFFSNPEAAHAWFVDTVIVQNPRITEEEKVTITGVAQTCYDVATDAPWTDPFGLFEHGRDDAAQYFNCLRNSIPGVTTDSGILSVLEIAADASLEAADPPDSMLNQGSRIASGEDPLLNKIPFWMVAGLGLLVYSVIK